MEKQKIKAIYIQTKKFKHASPLMEHITAPKIHVQYAKAMEAEGFFFFGDLKDFFFLFLKIPLNENKQQKTILPETY